MATRGETWIPEVLKAADVDDRIRSAATTIYQGLIEADLSSGGRFGVADPEDAGRSFFPSLLERRRRVDQSLFAVIMEAYLHSKPTRKVDDLVTALGADSWISKSEVSRICAELDVEVAAFRDRSLGEQPLASVRRSWWYISLPLSVNAAHVANRT